MNTDKYKDMSDADCIAYIEEARADALLSSGEWLERDYM